LRAFVVITRLSSRDAHRIDRIHEANDAVQTQGSLRLVACEFIDDTARVRGAARFDEQSRGFQVPQDVAHLLAEFHFSGAAKAAAGDEPHIVAAARVLCDRQGIEARVRELIQDHDPEFAVGLAAHEPPYRRGLTGAEAARDHVRARDRAIAHAPYPCGSRGALL
jgi:hypothetical protein